MKLCAALVKAQRMSKEKRIQKIREQKVKSGQLLVPHVGFRDDV